MTSDACTLSARMARLERQNRWLMCLAAIPMFALLMGADESPNAAPQKSVSAEEFVLVSADGKPRAKLLVAAEGATFALADKNGQTRVELAASAALGPRLVMMDEKQKIVLVAGQSDDNDMGYVEFHAAGQFKSGVGGNAIK